MSLTASDVCAIIKACGESGVVSLRYESLRLSFEKSSKEPRTPDPASFWSGPVGPVPPTLPVATLTASEHEQIQRDTLESDELDVREQQIEDLLLTEPLRAEELIIKGELESDGTDETDDE